MKVSKKWMAVLALPTISFVMAAEPCKDGVCPVPAAKPAAQAPAAKPAAQAPAAKPAAPAAKPAAAPAPAPAPAPVVKSAEEVLKFLPEVVLEVGNVKVTKAQVIAKFKAQIPEQFLGQIPEPQLKDMIKQMLTEDILLGIAEKNGFKPSEALVKKALQEQLAKLTPEQRQQLEARLKAANKTMAAFLDELAKDKSVQNQMAIQNWVMTKIAPTIKITDEEALKFYNDNKARLVSEESITASHILIQSAKPGDPAEDKKAEAKAKAILAQIRQGADFGTLAQAESACPSGKRAKGALGKMTKATLDQDFWNAAFKLKKGEISDVVKTQFGYHIIRLEDKTEAVPLKFEELKADIIAHLTDQKIQEKVAAAVEEATKSGFVKMGNF